MKDNFFPSSVYGGSAVALVEAMGARTSCALRSLGKFWHILASQERRAPIPRFAGTSPIHGGRINKGI